MANYMPNSVERHFDQGSTCNEKVMSTVQEKNF